VKLTNQEFGALVNGFQRSLFRLEALDDYAVSRYDERVQAFREGRPLPPSPPKEAWLKQVTEAVAAGKRIYRVHVLSQPLSDYLRYELTVYQENTAAGEEVFIADRSRQPDDHELRDLNQDFLLIDDAIVVWYRYDAGGHLLGYERSDDPVDLARCRRQRDTAMAYAVSLEEYLPTVAIAPPRCAPA
jgi:hypothetical protein